MRIRYLALFYAMVLPIVVFTACHSTTPTNPKYKLAQVVSVKNCQGTVINAFWSTNNEWMYQVAFNMTCPECKGEANWLPTTEVRTFKESDISPTSPAQTKPQPRTSFGP